MPPWIRADYAASSPEGSEHWLPVLAKFYFMWIEPEVMDVAELRRIQAPVLVLVGDHDFTSVEDALEMVRALPHGQLLVVPGAGHGKMTDRPRLVNQAIREFLDGAASR
jgi:pimeloyl-ACP methyl ester carboxylesterase